MIRPMWTEGPTEWTEHVAAAWTFPLQTGSDRLACQVHRNARIALHGADSPMGGTRINQRLWGEEYFGGEGRGAATSAATIID
jgi:hypothetical protein